MGKWSEWKLASTFMREAKPGDLIMVFAVRMTDSGEYIEDLPPVKCVIRNVTPTGVFMIDRRPPDKNTRITHWKKFIPTNPGMKMILDALEGKIYK